MPQPVRAAIGATGECEASHQVQCAHFGGGVQEIGRLDRRRVRVRRSRVPARGAAVVALRGRTPILIPQTQVQSQFAAHTPVLLEVEGMGKGLGRGTRYHVNRRAKGQPVLHLRQPLPCRRGRRGIDLWHGNRPVGRRLDIRCVRRIFLALYRLVRDRHWRDRDRRYVPSTRAAAAAEPRRRSIRSQKQ